jgi:hypothetical protein
MAIMAIIPQNNTEICFVLSWEALNMAQIDKLDKQAILSTQVEIENNLKRNNYEQIFKI